MALRAASTSAFAASFFATTGLSAAIAVVPDSLAVSRVVFVVASLIAVKAAVLSAFTLATAAAFSSSVAFGVELIAAILSSAAFSTASIAGCLSNLVKSDNGLTSLEPSLYVTTKLLPSFVIVEILSSLSSTFCPRLDSNLLSGFVLEYSIFTFSFTFSNSASVTAAGFATVTLSASVTSEISYFKVCGLRITLTAVGSASVPRSPLASAPSLSIAITKRLPNGVPPS